MLGKIRRGMERMLMRQREKGVDYLCTEFCCIENLRMRESGRGYLGNIILVLVMGREHCSL